MDYQKKIVLLVVVLLIALAVYFTMTVETPAPEEAEDTSEAQAILMKGLEFGKGVQNYVYSYMEVSDGYVTEYLLTTNGDDKKIEIRNPLSDKAVYFIENDTILCIAYPPSEEEVCTSVKDNNKVANYVSSVNAKFFSDNNIDNSVDSMEYLISNNYVKLNSDIMNKTVDGKDCKGISYVLDYSNISVSDAARFGIGYNSPKVFYWSMCIDNETGYPYEKSFTYEFEGMNHSYTYNMISFKEESDPIMVPLNLTKGAVDLLENEREKQVKLADCYTTMVGEEREQCIATLALSMKRPDLCEFAGDRKDRCLVSLVPVLKDESLCTMITDQSFMDDCYIELAGAYKNSTYCDNIQNQSKIEYCLEVATPAEPEPPETNETTNETGDDVDILDFLEYVDQYDSEENATNQTNETEGNATE